TNAARFPTSIAHMAYHEASRKIAAAPEDRSTDAIVLTFTPTTGNIVFDDLIINSGVTSGTPPSAPSMYDIEWSASGRYIYLSRHGEGSINADVLQYDYTDSDISLASVLPSPVFRSYGLQRGPDNRIYHLYQRTSAADPFLLGRIENPDSVAADAGYTATPA